VLAGPSTGTEEEEMHGFRRGEVPLSIPLLELVGDEEASSQKGDGVADPFMKSVSPPEQTTMAGEGGRFRDRVNR
jgi:hypothetical protein